jgi:hypothetical protein
MSIEPGVEKLQPGSEHPEGVQPNAIPAPGGITPGTPAAGESAPPKKLTREEQLALYEDELKNSDWGHQPC